MGVSYDAFSMRNIGGGWVSTRRGALSSKKEKREQEKKDCRLTKYAEITDDGDDINVCSGWYVCLGESTPQRGSWLSRWMRLGV